VFFSKVSGKEFPEIFEKSIDKHEIDAILDAPFRFGGLFWGRSDGRTKAGGFRGRIRRSHPDTRIPMRVAGSVHAFLSVEGTAGGHCAPCEAGVFFEKC